MKSASPHSVTHSVSADLLIKVENELTRCLAIANLHFGLNLLRPALVFDLKGNVAGSANPGRWRIRLNPAYFKNHPRESVETTVPHELAHLVDFVLHPENFVPNGRARGRGRRSLHGPTWKQIMRLFGANPERCHRMGPSPGRRITRRYLYRCPLCQTEVAVGPRHHASLQKPHVSARLVDCGHRITSENCIRLTPETRQALKRRAQGRKGPVV